MIKVLMVVFLTTFMSGCVGLPTLNPFASDTPSISVDAQVGKNNELTNGINTDEFAVSKVDSNDAAEYIIEDTKYGSFKEIKEIKIDERVPMWVWLLMIIGWLLPSPQEIWNGLGRFMVNIKEYFLGRKKD